MAMFDFCCDEDLGRFHHVCTDFQGPVCSSCTWASRCKFRWPLQVQVVGIKHARKLSESSWINGSSVNWFGMYRALRGLNFKRLGPSCTENDLPDKPDDWAWAEKDWRQPTFICSTGVHFAIDHLYDMLRQREPDIHLEKVLDMLRQMEADSDWETVTNYIDRGAFYLPILLHNTYRFSFKVSFVYGGLIGVADPFTGQPMLGFDIGGSATECGFDADPFGLVSDSERSALPNTNNSVLVGELRECCDPILQPSRMTLEVNVALTRLVLYEGCDCHGRVIGAVQQCGRGEIRTRKRAKTRGLRDSVLFFAFPEPGYVGLERVEIVEQKSEVSWDVQDPARQQNVGPRQGHRSLI